MKKEAVSNIFGNRYRFLNISEKHDRDGISWFKAAEGLGEAGYYYKAVGFGYRIQIG